MVSSDVTSRLSDAKIPRHLAVIPDGNRRWAASRGEAPTRGHREGFEVAKRLSRFCRRIGIHTVTVWAFSTENWRRSPEEVAMLMDLYEEWLVDLLAEAIEEEVRVVHLGRKKGVPEEAQEDARRAEFPGGLPEGLVRSIEDIEQKTGTFERNLINLAINYGGTDELQRAAHALALTVKGGVDPAGLDIRDFLDTAGQPHPQPDVVWRTSGELRVSGLLPLQSAYAEMVFTPKYFPELTENDVVDMVLEYSARVRRFGG